MPYSTFRDDGWFRFEKFEQLLFVRGNPTDTSSRAGHYHEDLGHFSLFKSGLPVLIDGGRKNYSDDKWGRFGLRPEAHNTITIDDYGLLPHSPTRFPTNYYNRPYTVTGSENEEVLQIDIETTGFDRIHQALSWCRTIRIHKEYSEVQDMIEGIDQRLITTFFHFAAWMDIIKKERNGLEFGNSSMRGSFQFDCAQDGQPLICKGGESLLGWQAVSYGKVVPAPTVTFRRSLKLPTKHIYKIVWGKD